MKAADYAKLQATFDRLDRLPSGEERDQAVEELRALLRGLRGEELRQALEVADRYFKGHPLREPAPRPRFLSA